MKLNALALVLPLLVTTSANAERVLVVMKDSAAFKKAHMAYTTKGNQFSGGLNLGVKSKAVGELEVALPHISAMIVDTQDASQIEKLQNSPEVAIVEREVIHPNLIPIRKGLLGAALVPGSVGESTPWGIYAVKAPQAWTAGNSQGEGARVLVLDTGIDEDHVSLKDNFEKGKDFTYSSVGYKDVNAHGTHVAGTIAGVMDNSGFVGVAPKAKILAGKVCSDEGGCSNFAIAAGINWGIQENVDVISMSLGGSMSTPAERRAISAADAAGITVVAASGNDGSGRVSYPAALPTVIAVGAISDEYKKTDFSQYGPELDVVAPGQEVHSSVPTGTGRAPKVSVSNGQFDVKVKSTAFAGSKEVPVAIKAELVYAGLGKPEEFKSVNVAGKFALVQRGEIAFSEKVQNAIRARAKGIVIFNNAPGLIQGSVAEEGQTVAIPAFMIEQKVGEDIVVELTKGSAVSATLETEVTDYSSFDGTSMATPHVSGVVALIKSVNKSLTGAQVKEILVKTAVKLQDNTELEVGAGLVDAEAAVRAAIEMKNANPPAQGQKGQVGEQLELAL